jgi:transposase-like protein
MQILEARCPRCGTNYHSEVLASFSRHVCQYCGANLVNRYRGGNYFHLHKACKLEEPEVKPLTDLPEVDRFASNLPGHGPVEIPGSEVESRPELESVCPECGARYSGSVVGPQHHQFCLRCGCDLELRYGGTIIRPSRPGFKADKYLYHVHSPMWENLITKNLSQFMIMN